MSDLSWLNPTPHAIAVYASRPLSPVATQHSLPSGRYSLLGPDFHRLDHTSLRLAHSFDHLVGAHQHAVRHVEIERLCRLHIQHGQEFHRRLHWHIGGLLASENTVNIAGRAPHLIDKIRPMGDQAAGRGEAALVIDRRQFVSGSKHDDETTVRYSKRAGCQDQTAIAGTCEGDDAALDLTGVAHVDWSDVHLERRSHRLDDAELADPGGHCGIANDHRAGHPRCNLLEQLKPFATDAIFE